MNLQTPRLYLRQFVEDDVDELFRLDADPKVMKYIGAGLPRTNKEAYKAAIPRLLKRYKETPGLGSWACIQKATNRFIGWHLLKQLDKTEEIEIGYRLHTEFWGKGYATEMARELLHYGFTDLQLPRIVAITHHQNHASDRVIQKLGIPYQRDGVYYGYPVRYYALNREDYRY